MLRVLIADKQPALADALSQYLLDLGHQTAAVYGGHHAVELAASFRPDVFISDVMMPGMTGIDAGILVRVMLPSCRIILLEDGVTAGLLERAKLQGHDFETIRKPFEPRLLLSVLRSSPTPHRPARREPMQTRPIKRDPV